MSDVFRAEFTGERVIPGAVEENLFSEHIARYRFAVHLAGSLRLDGKFLDAGCGAGYGAAELAKSGAEVVGIDVAEDAVQHARTHYGGVPGIRFEVASCTAIPGADAGFRMVTAFEVIEHLEQWREFLSEARRVLDPRGVFLVSTPNRLYYAETRQKVGPNPFHVHEFTEAEFRAELESVFPHVAILLQNHVEGIGFTSSDMPGAALEISDRRTDPSDAHFFLAVCGLSPLPPVDRFVYIADAGNVLQTRERHIALLEGEIRQKNEWIRKEQAERSRMLAKVDGIEVELLRSNAWARARDIEATERGRRIEALQAEVAEATAWAKRQEQEIIATREGAEERGRRVLELQEEVVRVTDWAKSRDAEIEERDRSIRELQNKLTGELAAMSAGYEAAIEQWRHDKKEADEWALDNERRLKAEETAHAATLERMAALETELGVIRNRMSMIAQSRWVRMGRRFRVGPEIETTQP